MSSEYKKSVLFMIIVATIVMTAFSYSCDDEEYKIEPATDSEILYSRKYVIDFDQRIADANKFIFECVSATVPTQEALKMCTANAYDAQGLANSEKDNKVVLLSAIVKDYDNHKRISLNPLSTEIN